MPREIPRRIEIVRYEDLKVSLDQYWKDRRWWKMYKTIPVFAAKDFEDILVKDPDSKFIDWVAGEVTTFMAGEGKVAADIRAPILNISDDLLSGRPPVIRAGDYIALRTHFQKM